MQLSKKSTYKYTDASRRSSANEGREYAKLFALGMLVPIAIGLMLTDESDYKAFISGDSSKWVETIVATGEFDWLFDSNRQNRSGDGNQNESREELTRQAYVAVFDDAVHNSQYGEVQIGHFLFSKGIRSLVLDSIHLVSHYSDYSV